MAISKSKKGEKLTLAIKRSPQGKQCSRGKFYVCTTDLLLQSETVGSFFCRSEIICQIHTKQGSKHGGKIARMPTQKKIFPRALDPPLRPTLTESFEIRRHTEDGRAFLTSGKDKKKLLRRHTVQSSLEKHAGRRSTKLLQKMS